MMYSSNQRDRESPTPPEETGPMGDGTYKVRQGECMESIAVKKGLFWQTIWDDDKNSKIKGLRKNPNALLEGDKLYIRPIEMKEDTAPSGAKHCYKRKGSITYLTLIILDEEEKPRANAPYLLTVDDEVFEASTNEKGEIKHAISPIAKKAHLVVKASDEENEDEDYELDLRCLDPATESSGVQGRLLNLGYAVGVVDGSIGPRTMAALSEFQLKYKLEITGKPDKKTLEKLIEVYGDEK